MMLVEFRVSNFMSIKESVTLSLVKGQGKELADTNTFDPKARATPELLRSAVIYGANAAGKSNVVKAMQMMQRIILFSEYRGGDKKIPWVRQNYLLQDELVAKPFLLDKDSKNEASEFEITFIVDNVRYQYGFSFTKERIVEEWLLAFPKGKAQQWIQRYYDKKQGKYVWGGMDKLFGKKNTWQDVTHSTALFLSTAVQLNSEQLKPIIDWFRISFQVVVHDYYGGHTEFDSNLTMILGSTTEKRMELLEFLKVADSAIYDLKFINKNKGSKDCLLVGNPEYAKDLNIVIGYRTKSKKVIYLDLGEMSAGIQKIFWMAGSWLDILKLGLVLVVDELHHNLHPHIVRYLVSLFNNPKTNPKNAQLIFTTHDTTILDQALFRRDQVWFCEKNDEQATELYSLSDFSPRKGTENIERGYLAGRYGAVPFIKSGADC